MNYLSSESQTVPLSYLVLQWPWLALRYLNLRSPARPLVVSSSGKSSKGGAWGVTQYLWRVPASSARLSPSLPSSMKPLAQHTKPAAPSSMGYTGRQETRQEEPERGRSVNICRSEILLSSYISRRHFSRLDTHII